jgi:hypothetical protein
MHVNIYELVGHGEDRLTGVLRLQGGKIIPEPDAPWLHRLLAEPLYDPRARCSYDSQRTPEDFLRYLHRQYTSAYFRVSQLIVDDGDPFEDKENAAAEERAEAGEIEETKP